MLNPNLASIFYITHPFIIFRFFYKDTGYKMEKVQVLISLINVPSLSTFVFCYYLVSNDNSVIDHCKASLVQIKLELQLGVLQ